MHIFVQKTTPLDPICISLKLLQRFIIVGHIMYFIFICLVNANKLFSVQNLDSNLIMLVSTEIKHWNNCFINIMQAESIGFVEYSSLIGRNTQSIEKNSNRIWTKKGFLRSKANIDSKYELSQTKPIWHLWPSVTCVNLC